MSYETDFSGEIMVRIHADQADDRQLPDEFVDRWNAWIATEEHRDSGATFQQGGPDRGSGTQEYISWTLSNRTTVYDGLQPTWIIAEGSMYEYGSALQYLVACIRHEFPDAEFEGAVDWSGEEPGDLGTLTVDAAGIVHEDSRALAAQHTDRELAELVAAVHARRALDEESEADFAAHGVDPIKASAYLASAREINERIDAALVPFGDTVTA